MNNLLASLPTDKGFTACIHGNILSVWTVIDDPNVIESRKIIVECSDEYIHPTTRIDFTNTCPKGKRKIIDALNDYNDMLFPE